MKGRLYQNELKDIEQMKRDSVRSWASRSHDFLPSFINCVKLCERSLTDIFRETEE